MSQNLRWGIADPSTADADTETRLRQIVARIAIARIGFTWTKNVQKTAPTLALESFAGTSRK